MKIWKGQKMEWGIFLGTWFGLAALSLAILIDSWRQDLDVTRRDLVFHGLMSLFGPISLLAALVVWVITAMPRRDSPVIWPRKRGRD